jgi:hypothetical protein
VLVFVFAPTLMELSRWLYFELTNPLNLRDPIVLGFLLVRGVDVLLGAFAEGVAFGVLAGALDGLLVSAWVLSSGRVSTRGRRLLLGALSGGLAAGVVVLAVVSRQLLTAGQVTSRGVAIAFELVSGVVCGTLAAPTAVRLLGTSTGRQEPGADAPSGATGDGGGYPPPTSRSASQT